MRSNSEVSHCLDCCHGLLPLVLVLRVFNYLMESAKCPAREVSFFLFYKLDKSRLRGRGDDLPQAKKPKKKTEKERK